MSYFKQMKVHTGGQCGILYVTDDRRTAQLLRDKGEAVLIYFHEGNRDVDFSGFLFGVEEPENLERLVYEAGGTDEVERYLASCRRGGTYAPSETVLAKMNRGLSVSVVSSSRISQTISSVYRTHRYVLSPGSALSYAGLMDYRAKAGQARNALILAEKSPVLDSEIAAAALNIARQELIELL